MSITPSIHATAPPVPSPAQLNPGLACPLRLAALVCEGRAQSGPDRVFDRFARIAARVSNVPVAAVSLIDDDQSYVAGIGDEDQPGVDPGRPPLWHSLSGEVVAREAPLVIGDARSDCVPGTKLAPAELGVVAYAGCPIADSDGRVLGSLCAVDMVPRDWDPLDLEALSDVAELIGADLQRRRTVWRLTCDASTDALTGLANRRPWDERLARGLSQAQQLGEPLTAMIIDLDNFKAHNDRHGHLAGDEVLREIGLRWSAVVRDVDLLARIGGEEFGLLLPGCDARDAITVFDRMRADMPGELTASAGIAVWHAPQTATQLVSVADRELYRAKAEGRDRACVAADSLPESGGGPAS